MSTDEGGEAPCFAHLLDESLSIDDATLASLVRELADAVVIADAGGTIRFWNDAAVRVFGWSAAEALGQSLDLIIPERQRDRHWTGYRHTMATGETKYGDQLLEVPALHRDGRKLSIAFTVTLLRHEGDQHPCGIAAVVRDDTERWQEQRLLRQAQPRTGVAMSIDNETMARRCELSCTFDDGQTYRAILESLTNDFMAAGVTDIEFPTASFGLAIPGTALPAEDAPRPPADPWTEAQPSRMLITTNGGFSSRPVVLP